MKKNSSTSLTPPQPPKTPAKTETLCDWAEQNGIPVIWTPHLSEAGRWVQTHGVILIRPDMPEAATVSVLAHELGHWWYGDTGSSSSIEARAWQWAARVLIDPADYARAEQIHPSAGSIARELGVLTDVVDGYRGLLAKQT
ncbi:ImmA/IrrE family metallo-endopeptidase [Dermabacteraceae bacterium P13138]